MLFAERKVAVLGATGQLGTDLVKVLESTKNFEVVPLTHEQADCSRQELVREALTSVRPSTVINCAAYVRVDDCEDHPKKAFEVNAIGTFHVARVCAELNALCVYMSTDYVFDGSKESAYVESDTPRPINVYGTSKLAGEYLVQQAAPRFLIVRMASLFGKTGARGKGGNFIETILAKARDGEPLRIVNDIRMSPTYTRDAARAMVELLQTGATGLFHLTNQGSCSWYEFAGAVLETTGLTARLEPVDSIDYPTRARRPKNSALESERSFDKLRPWEEALEAYLKEKGHIPLPGSRQGAASNWQAGGKRN